MPIIDVPFKRVAIDLIGKINPASEEGHTYILTLVDYATRYPEAVALKKIDAITVAEELYNIYTRIGIPEEVLSDLGRQFISECMKEVNRLLGIKKLYTSRFNPKTNGLNERWNGSLKMMLKRLCHEQPEQWHRYLNPLLFAYREVPQASTGFSPFELIYGKTVRGPLQIMKELWTGEEPEVEVKNSYKYVFDLRERIENTLMVVRENLKKAQDRQKHYYDRRAKDRKLEIGDEVVILIPQSRNKLLMEWSGPYHVMSRNTEYNYGVKVRGKIRTYHINLLKKFISREEVRNEIEGERAMLTIINDFEEDENIENEEQIITCKLKSEEDIINVKIGKSLTAK